MNVGDEVTLFRRCHLVGIYRVDKVTPTGRIKIGDAYYRRNGDRFGYDWLLERIVPTTQEHRDEIEKSRLVSLIRGNSFKGLSVSQLRRIVEVIHEGESK